MQKKLARPLGALVLAALLAACGNPPPPTAPPSTDELVVRPLPDDSFEGTVFWELDASAVLDGEDVESRVWHLGGVDAESWSDVVARGYGHEGTFDVGMTATLADGTIKRAEATITVDDLPYDYWGEPPTRVNQQASGEELPLDFVVYWEVSADGRYVAFTTSAAGLPDADTNAASDVYVKDMDTGELILASADATGAATGGKGPVAMSGDGSHVAYVADGLVAVVELAALETTYLDDPGDYAQIGPVGLDHDGSHLVMSAHTTNNPLNAGYVVDLSGPTFERLGALDGGGWANVLPTDISPDGSTAVFSSSDAVVAEDDNDRYDVYAYSVSTGDVTLVSADSGGAPGEDSSSAAGKVTSSDGRYVVFYTESGNLPRAAENDVLEPNQDVYRKDLQTGELLLVSTNALDHAADDDSILPTISGDGRYVAFGAYAGNLAPHFDDLDSCFFELCANGFAYVKDLGTGRVAMVSVGEHETLPDGWDQIEPVITEDGRYVIFYSQATNLGYGEQAGEWSLYRAVNPLWE